MARLASSDTVRFTPAQRDALIDLAARLQAEQEATVGMDELARATAEAGVDPRFLDEAARRLATRPGANPRDALIALGGLAFFDALFLGIVLRSWFFPIAGALRLPLLMAAGFAFAWTFGRNRALRWAAPAAPVAIFVALGLVGGLLHFLRGGGAWWYHLPQALFACALAQALGAAVASLLRRDP